MAHEGRLRELHLHFPEEGIYVYTLVYNMYIHSIYKNEKGGVFFSPMIYH